MCDEVELGKYLANESYKILYMEIIRFGHNNVKRLKRQREKRIKRKRERERERIREN